MEAQASDKLVMDKAPSRSALRSPRRSGWRGSGLRTDLMEQTVNEYLAALEALFRNPNDEAARAWWTSEGYAPPIHPTVPLETIHKARLQWLDATDDMLAESRAFLFEHGYGGVPHLRAYTSRSRDAERAKRGLPPLIKQTI